MFGIFRLVLAVMVVVTHIGGIEIVAGFAVWGFFLLSGFLMTAVLNRKYGFSPAGIAAFATSRALRLLPTYWLSLAITAWLVLRFDSGVAATVVNDALAWPVGIGEWLASLLIVGHTTLGLGRVAHALSPSAWAVDVEILMYLCSCIFLARSARMARITLVVLALAYPLWWFLAKRLIAQGDMVLANELTYSFLPSALLPYAAGSVLWFYRDRLSARWNSATVGTAAAVTLLAAAFIVARASVTVAYLLSIPCMAVLVLNLSRHKTGGWLARIDDVAGRMSYPVYLAHWFCAYLVVLAATDRASLVLLTGGHARFTALGFFVVLGLVLLVSLVFAIFVEGPVEKLRHAAAARIALRPQRRAG